MDPFKALVLGVVQGLTEFLPVSSTGHLRIVPAFVGWDDPGAAFSAIIQLGTTLAVLIYFRRDLSSIARGFLVGLRRPREAARTSPEARMGWYLVLATVPIGLAGLAFTGQIESGARSLPLIASTLIAFSVVMVAAERFRPARERRTQEQVTLADAIAVGAAQALALVPGVSRSASTISAGLFMGLDRRAAARFSFLLSTPAIVLAALFELRGEAGHLTPGDALEYAVGIAAAFVTGYVAIAFLLRFLATNTLIPFVAYRVPVGAIVLILWATEAIH